MLPRDDFATALLIQLAEAGEAAAVYDAANFSILRQSAEAGGSGPTGHCRLDRWYERFLQAEPRGQGDQVIREFVVDWFQLTEQPNPRSTPQEEPIDLELALNEVSDSSASAPVPASTPVQAAATVARPLPPPPEIKPPPEPSWWPLIGCGMVAVLSLGCCVGGIFGGIGWVEHALRSQSAAGNAERIAQPRKRDPARDRANARNRRNPMNPLPLPRPLGEPPPAVVADDLPQAAEPLGEPPAAAMVPPAPVGDPVELQAARFQEDIRAAMRQFEQQMAEIAHPPLPPLPFVPEPPAARPAEPKLLPIPLPGAAEVELPRLTVGPADIESVGPEIHGEHLFQDTAPAGGWLVGFRAIKGDSWGGSILALQPIYQVGTEYVLGEQCGGGVGGIDQQQFLAKPGYAVGKIEARFGLIMNAFRLEFRRVKDGRLDPADAYFSEWYGGEGGGPTGLDGRTSPLVGIAGSYHPRDEVITIQALKVK